MIKLSLNFDNLVELLPILDSLDYVEYSSYSSYFNFLQILLNSLVGCFNFVDVVVDFLSISNSVELSNTKNLLNFLDNLDSNSAKLNSLDIDNTISSSSRNYLIFDSKVYVYEDIIAFDSYDRRCTHYRFYSFDIDYTGRFVYASFDTKELLLNNVHDTALVEINSFDTDNKLEELCFNNMLNFENNKKYRDAVLNGDWDLFLLEKMFKPTVFNSSADLNFIGAQWYLDFSKLIFFFFFFACTSLYFFFMYFFQVLATNQEYQNFSRETRGLSRAQFGDTFTAVIPMTWSITMLMHANVNSNNFDENTADCTFILTITAYQWGWNYYFPKDIVSILTKSDILVGHNSVFSRSSYDANFYNILFDFYRFQKLSKQSIGSYGSSYSGKNIIQSINSLYLRSNLREFSYNLPLSPFSNFSDISLKLSDLSTFMNLNIIKDSSNFFSKNVNSVVFDDDSFIFHSNLVNSSYLNKKITFNSNFSLINNNIIFSNYFSDFLNFSVIDFASDHLVPSSKLSYSLDSLANKNNSSRFIFTSNFDNSLGLGINYLDLIDGNSPVSNFSRFNLVLNSRLEDANSILFFNFFANNLADRLFNYFGSCDLSLLNNLNNDKLDDSSLFFFHNSFSRLNVFSNFFNINYVKFYNSLLLNSMSDLSFFKNSSVLFNFLIFNSRAILLNNLKLSSVTNSVISHDNFISSNLSTLASIVYSYSYNFDSVTLSNFLTKTPANNLFNLDFLNNLIYFNTNQYSQKFNRLSTSNLDPLVFNYKLSDSSVQIIYSNNYLLNTYALFKNNLSLSSTLNFNSDNSVFSNFLLNDKFANFNYANLYFKFTGFNASLINFKNFSLSSLLSSKQNNNFVEYFYKNNDDLDMNFISKFLLPDVVSTRNLNKFSKFNSFIGNLNFSIFKKSNANVNLDNDSFIFFNFLFFKNTVDFYKKNTAFLDVFINDLNLSSKSLLFSYNNYNIFKPSLRRNLNNTVFFNNRKFTFDGIKLNNIVDLFQSSIKRDAAAVSGFLKLDDSVSVQKRLNVSKGIFLPSDMNIHLICGSKDVIHSWAIPGLGVKIDCIPGFNSHRRLNLRWRGTFWGQCMEVCGRYHHWMPILVKVVHKDQFLIWCLYYLRVFNKRNLYEKQLLSIEAASLVWSFNQNNFNNFKEVINNM